MPITELDPVNLMEKKLRYATLGAIVTVAAVMFGAYGADNLFATMSAPAEAAALLSGHVTYVAKDVNGNIKQYFQTDNLIVNQGEDCVTAKLFAAQVGSCEAADTAGYTVIAIGNGSSSATPADGDTDLNLEFTTVSGLGRVAATTTTFTPASGSSAAKAVLSADFTNNSVNDQTISESGLFNSTNTADDALFARQVFTNNVTLANGESLTVEWTINIGGTTTFN